MFKEYVCKFYDILKFNGISDEYIDKFIQKIIDSQYTFTVVEFSIILVEHIYATLIIDDIDIIIELIKNIASCKCYEIELKRIKGGH